MTHFIPPLFKPIQLLSGIEKNRFGKQMKQMKTSERKHTPLSIILHLFFLCSFFCYSCDDSHNKLNFKTTDKALEVYREEFKKIKELDIRSAAQLSAVVNEWKQLSDTVFNFIQKDPSYNAHVGLSLEFIEVTDSIKSYIMQIGDQRKWSLKDLAVLKLNTPMLHSSKTFKDAVNDTRSFYQTLDTVQCQVYNSTEQFMSSYVNFLRFYSGHTFNEENDLKLFIKEEDVYFRYFLNNLNQVLANDLTEVTHYTEVVCKNIFKAANDDKIKDETTLAYMAMRTNRRVLENARICSVLIDRKTLGSPEVANTYLWMLIQPYLVIDSLSMSVLTDEQKDFFVSLAENYPRLVNILKRERLLEDDLTDTLPTRMFKLYLTTL